VKAGTWYAVGAYAIWGLVPLYWKALASVPAVQLACHRTVWSCLLLVVVLVARRQWKILLSFLREPRAGRIIGVYLVAAVLVGLNWWTYVWGVNAGRVVETSLGYFINPLLSVMLGVVLLRERLRAWQWAPIVCAAAGMVCVTIGHGAVPWIALTLATTFGLYGLMKKIAPLGAAHGLTLETALLTLPALGYLLWCEYAGNGAVMQAGVGQRVLLVGTGVLTTVPLLMFAVAARRCPLTLIGILQYITPTLQFLLGVLVYRESCSGARLWGFILVWIGLIVFAVESVLNYRTQLLALAVHEELS
jgi:chloramphenicol-sensitive protein RarD